MVLVKSYICYAKPKRQYLLTCKVRRYRILTLHGIHGCRTEPTQQTRHVDPMLFECWPAVSDVGSTFKQHWVNVSCLLGSEILSHISRIVKLLGYTTLLCGEYWRFRTTNHCTHRSCLRMHLSLSPFVGRRLTRHIGNY